MVAVYLRQDLLVAVGLGTLTAALVLRRWLRAKPSVDPNDHQIHALDSHHAVFGDFAEFIRNKDRLHDWMLERSLQLNGQSWRIHLPGMRSMVVLTDPELIEETSVAQFDNFQKSTNNTVFTDLFGESLITWDGEKWYRQRKAATKFFTAKALRVCMTTNMQRNMDHVYGVIDKHIGSGEGIDLLKLFHEFTLQTFAEVGLGVDLNIIGTEGGHPMEHAAEDVTPVFMRRLGLPQFVWKLERYLNIGPERIITKSMAQIREWLTGVVNQSLASAAKRQASGLQKDKDIKSVVELFLEQSDEDKEGLRSEDLVSFILTFVLAARSTSALTLGWTFMVLAKHPEVTTRLQKEITSAFPEAESMYLTTEHIAQLPYLEATIKEVLRLYPVIPMNQKQAVEDTLIGGDLVVKKGEYIAIPYYAMARLPSVWGPDAAEFKPERWIDETTGKLLNVSNSKFAVFGTGPRICIGMKLAMLELRVVIANLLSRYDFTLAVRNDLSHIMAVELMPAAPMVMYAHKKAAAAF